MAESDLTRELAADLDEELSDIANLLGKERALGIAEALIAKGWHRPTEPDEDVREALRNVLYQSNVVPFEALGKIADDIMSRFHVTPRGEKP